MSMPFNMIYQAAYDREGEIRKDSSYKPEQVKQEGRFARVLSSLLSRSERKRGYTTTAATCASEQAAK